MKKILLAISVFSAFSSSVFAEDVCGAPRTNVTVKIDYAYRQPESIPFCYATEIDTKNRYEILDCGFLNVGDVVSGTVYTHWLGKDSNGNPICNYQTFEPQI